MSSLEEVLTIEKEEKEEVLTIEKEEKEEVLTIEKEEEVEVITAEEARKIIKEYEDRNEELRMKTLKDFNEKIKII